MTFSPTVLEHFQSPRNVGEIDSPDAQAEDENPVCGDRLHLWIRIEGGVIQDAKWRGEGCVPAIAAASVASEMLRSMSLEDARTIDTAAITEALGGLPPRKAHAAALAASAIRRALDDYEARRANPDS